MYQRHIKFKRTGLWMISMITLFGLIIACSSDLFRVKEVPVITGLEANQYEVNPGDTVLITVSVKNGDEASLQYKWSANGGQFIPPVNQSQVLWRAPEEGGDYKITVVVSNEDGNSDPSFEFIHVRIKESPEIISMTFSKYEVDPGDTVQIFVMLNDMNDPTLVFDWTADDGQFLPPTNQSTVFWKAPSVGGEYHITLTVSNNQKQSNPHTETITVRSYTAPFIQITEPEQGAVFIQYSTIHISCIANHRNGIESVSLYVNGLFKSLLNGKTTEEYQFTYELTDPEGFTELRVEAVAKTTGVIGVDTVQIRIEGIVFGK